jgi:hypothetical protein
MISWIVVGILVVLGIIVIKMSHFRRKFFTLVLIFLALLLFSGFYFVYSKNGADLSSVDGLKTTGKLYLGWFANGFNNMKSLTGNAIKMDWSNTNSSLFNESKNQTKIKK